MNRFHLKRPTAALLISCLALFLVLGGTVYAASLINGKSIKKGSIPGNRLKKHTLTRAQINLNKLGTVKAAKKANFATHAVNATNATNAVNATNATNATNAVNATNATHAKAATTTEQIKTWYATASVGQTVTLLTIGPFTYTGECKEESGGPYAQTWAETSQTGSAADSYADEEGYETHSAEQTPWNPGQRVTVGYYSQEHASYGEPGWTGPYDGSDTQISGDGHTYVNTFASVGTQFHGADCVFVGHAVVITH